VGAVTQAVRPEVPAPRPARPRLRLADELTGDAVRVVRLLGLHPGPSADTAAVAALAGLPRPAARAALAGLHDAGLLTAAGGRHHPAAGGPAVFAGRRPAGADEEAAWLRLLRHLLATASAAVTVAFPPGPAVALPPFPTVASARAWLDAELPTLLAVPDAAFALRLAPLLADWLHATSRHRAADELLSRALDGGGDPAQRLRLAAPLARLGRHREAVELYRAAPPPEDPERLTDLGVALFRLQRYGQARRVFARALALSRARGDRAGEGAALVALGACHQGAGNHLQALAWHTEAYWVCTRAGYEQGRLDARRGMQAAAAELPAPAVFR
jgi:tetratricopeptide (TPR) repeat protein